MSTPPAPPTPPTPAAPPVPAAPVRRDDEAGRAAVLRAARHLLARHAHADITLKAVAERAGVSPPLILKCFGNKDALLARLMSFETDAAALLDAPLEDLGRHMVRQVVVSRSEHGTDPLLRIVFAPLHGPQGDIMRADFRAQVTERLTERLTGPEAGLRAEPAVGALLGIGVCTASSAAPMCVPPPSTSRWTGTRPPCTDPSHPLAGRDGRAGAADPAPGRDG
ncbi:hypothetical protein GCM10027073_22060 [Streptomyces chlorus]